MSTTQGSTQEYNHGVLQGIQPGEYPRLIQGYWMNPMNTQGNKRDCTTRGVHKGIKETVPDGYNQGYNAGE